MKLNYILIGCLLLMAIVSSVSAANLGEPTRSGETTIVSASGSCGDDTCFASTAYTDWDLWILSGLIGVVLFMFTLNPTKDQDQLELDAIISIMAWIPIAFCAYASFAVGRMVAVHTIILYSFPVIGVIMGVFLLVAMFNTYRIFANHKSLNDFTGLEPSGGDYE